MPGGVRSVVDLFVRDPVLIAQGFSYSLSSALIILLIRHPLDQSHAQVSRGDVKSLANIHVGKRIVNVVAHDPGFGVLEQPSKFPAFRIVISLKALDGVGQNRKRQLLFRIQMGLLPVDAVKLEVCENVRLEDVNEAVRLHPLRPVIHSLPLLKVESKMRTGAVNQ
jgi:hypothetical protein